MNKVEFSRTAKFPFAKRYDNYIGGKWVAPKSGKYFEYLAGDRPSARRGGPFRCRRHRGCARRGSWGDVGIRQA